MMRAYWNCVEAFMGPGHLEWRKEICKMANKNADLARHYIADESLGGIEREYVEVEREANVGDYVIHESAGIHGIFEHTDGIFAFIKFDGSYSGRDAWYLSKTVTVQPTDIVRIGKQVDAETSLCVHERYRLVERPAEDGEKIIVSDKVEEYDGDYENGDIFDVRGVHEGYAKILDNVGEVYFLYHREYRVLEPAEAESNVLTVDETQASPQVIDMLANLAKRVSDIERQNNSPTPFASQDEIIGLHKRLNSLEEQLRDTQRNVETFAQQTEANTEAIKALSDRPQKKSHGKTLRFEQDGLTNWRVYQDDVELKGVTSVRIKASQDDFTMYDVQFIAGVTADENGN